MMSRRMVRLNRVIVVITTREQEGTSVYPKCGDGVVENTENRITLGGRWD